MNIVPVKPGISYSGDEIAVFKSDVKVTEYTYLMAGVHGDEVEGVYCLDKLYKWIQSVESISTPLIIIPILNVDGYRASTRLNAMGVDLNRNFPSSSWSADFKEKKYCPGEKPLSSPEDVYLVKLFEKYPPNLVITFHTWKRMINYNGSCRGLAEFVSTYNSYPVVTELGHKTNGSLGHYLPEKSKTPVLTLEFPEFNDDLLLKDIWKENEKALKEMMLNLGEFL